ncbi:ion transport peptide-like isoform X1 [Photinus pyralis]|uniref:Ion transport peptide-like protein n=1 Tax=Photinus pyralis TaxID=7054 RepID=A0A1Y1KRM2_PHOPY|nr:ion transport peptide-like isoform X1 [Photinus pyralis]
MHRRSSTSIYTKGVWVCMALTLVIQLAHCTPTQRSRPLLSHHLTKRAFADQQCKGVYDKSIYARLDRICEDCYNLFREPELHSLCKKNCFKSPYFQTCIDTLNLGSEAAREVYEWVKRMNKRRL